MLDITLGGNGPKISKDASAILAESKTTGEVTRLQVARAAELSSACVEQAGMTLSLTVPADDFTGYEAQVRLDTGDGADNVLAEKLGLVAQACLDENLYAVELLYLQQPAATEINDAKRDQHFEQYRSALVSCLGTSGYPTDADAPQSEIREILAQEATANGARSCMFTTGFSD